MYFWYSDHTIDDSKKLNPVTSSDGTLLDIGISSIPWIESPWKSYMDVEDENMQPAGNNSLSDIFGPPAPPAPPAPPQVPHLVPIPEDTVLTAPEISAAPDQPMAASPGGQPLDTPPGLVRQKCEC